MLVKCKIINDYPLDNGSTEFIISVPAGVILVGSYVCYQGNLYDVKVVVYNDDTGELIYKVGFVCKNIGDGDDPKSIAYHDYFLKGEKLQAVKFLKEHMAIGLKEAKEIIDSWEQQRHC